MLAVLSRPALRRLSTYGLDLRKAGVRHVIPGRANYLAGQAASAPARNLVTGGGRPLLPHIVAHLATADRADIVVSFALESGVHRVFEHFRDLLARGGRLRILTGDYLGITEPNAWIWGRPGWTKVVHYWRDIHDRART